MQDFKIISWSLYSEGNRKVLKSAVFFQRNVGSCLHPSINYELESCLKSMKKRIFFPFFFTRVESYFTRFKIFANLSSFEKKTHPKTVCEMYKTSNSLKLVYFQAKKPKNLMITRKIAMCFCAGDIKYSFPLSEEQFSVKKSVWLSFG